VEIFEFSTCGMYDEYMVFLIIEETEELAHKILVDKIESSRQHDLLEKENYFVNDADEDDMPYKDDIICDINTDYDRQIETLHFRESYPMEKGIMTTFTWD
jgi:hypothetical protein